jgi:cubilin
MSYFTLTPLFALGTIYDSGNSNGNYANNEYREQLIKCDPYRLVNFQILQLAIGASGTTSECSKDFLKIYDGPSTSSPLLFLSSTTLCSVSSTSPLWFFSSSNQVYIRFTSDGSITGAGYTIKYSCSPKLDILGGTLYDSGGAAADYSDNEVLYSVVSCPVGRAPVLSFTQMEIDGTMPACSTDSIKVYDAVKATTYGYTVTLKYTGCGVATGSSLWQGSLAKSALITFTSDGAISKAGFALTYDCTIPVATALGGWLYDSGGASANYGNNEVWEQRIQCPPSKTISIWFSTLTVDTTGGCTKDYITIYNGPSAENATTLYRGCTLPSDDKKSMMSTSNQVYLRFISDASVTAAGYSLFYVCSSVFASPSGTITDSGGPNSNYGNSENIINVIKCGSNQFATISFTQLDIDGTFPTCSTDSVHVMSYTPSPSSPASGALSSIYRGCGSTTGTSLWQGGVMAAYVWIQFMSDSSISKAGYSLNYQCKSIPTVTTGTLTDSGGPTANYKNNESNKQMIQCENTMNRVYASFTAFSFEVSVGCHKDYMTIYDGPYSNGTVLFTGCTAPSPSTVYLSSAHEMLVTYTTDGQITSSGYSLKYYCSQIYSSNNGTIFDSGGISNPYSYNEDSLSMVICAGNQYPSLEFTSLDMDGTFPSCATDKIGVFSTQSNVQMSGSLSTNLLYSGCGQAASWNLWQGVSASNAMVIRMVSDSTTVKAGYSIKYECQPIPTFTSPRGTLTDTGGTVNNYGNDEFKEQVVDCRPQYQAVQFYFSKFAFEVSENCTNDFVEVYDGRSSSGALLFYGCEDPGASSKFIASSNHIYVTYSTDGSSTAAGYELQYQCLSVYNSARGNMTDSGGLLGPYSNNENVLEAVMCPTGQWASSRVVELNIEGSFPLCTNDKLVLYAGVKNPLVGWTLNPVYSRCGPFTGDSTTQVLSASGLIILSFTSNSAVTAPGYVIDYECQITPTYYSMWGIVYDISGGALSDYANMENTTQVILCPPAKVVYFHFVKLNLEYSVDCLKDNLVVYDHLTPGSKTLLFSGCTDPGSNNYFLSQSNKISIQFTSDNSTTEDGYDISYICADRISGSLSGTVFDSGGSLGSYRSFDSTAQVIVCPESQYVAASITTFDIEGTAPACTVASLKIYSLVEPSNGMGYALNGLDNQSCGAMTAGVQNWNGFSSLNSLLLRFESNGGVTKAGYTLTYECQVIPTYTKATGVLYDSGGRRHPIHNHPLMSIIMNLFRFSRFQK